MKKANKILPIIIGIILVVAIVIVGIILVVGNKGLDYSQASRHI